MQLRRTKESDRLLELIQSDPLMMMALTPAIEELWLHHRQGLSETGLAGQDPAPLLVPVLSNLISTLLERKISTLRSHCLDDDIASELEYLLKNAGLFVVAEDLLRAALKKHGAIACEEGLGIDEDDKVASGRGEGSHSRIEQADALRIITGQIDNIESAVEAHPHKTISVYKRFKDQIIFDISHSRPAWPEGFRPTPFEERIIYRYLCASSFMTAWYHLRGDKANRDKGSHAAAIILWGAGVDPIFGAELHIRCEEMWVKILKENLPSLGSGCLGLVLSIALVVYSFVQYLGIDPT